MWTIQNKTPRRRIRNFFLGLAALIVIPTLINIIFNDFEQFISLKNYIKEISYGFMLGLLFWVGNWGLGNLTGRKLNWRKNPSRANMISLLSFMTWGVLVSLSVPFIFIKYVWMVPEERFLNTLMGNAFLCITVDLIIMSIYYSNYIVFYWGKSIKNEEKLKRENLLARYEALQNQVNPHFLFNTLNTLSGVVEQNPGKASEFIHRLSEIYRYVLEQRDRDLIDLQEELKFVNDYIFLSKIRYEDGLQVENLLSDKQTKIVPLGLQMLIENAIKHNVISDDKPLTIELGIIDNYIFVRNNLQTKSTATDTKQVGLENLVKRYEYLTDRPVIVNETATHFEVKLPILQNPES